MLTKNIEKLSREELLKLIQVYAMNWLAHDGCWFLAAEEKYSMEAAIELDAKSWERFAVAEARRIMKAFDIPSNGGLKALEKALQYCHGEWAGSSEGICASCGWGVGQKSRNTTRSRICIKSSFIKQREENSHVETRFDQSAQRRSGC